MALALEIAFATGLAVVALSFVAVARGRVRERQLVWLAVMLAVAAIASAALLAVNLAEHFTDREPLLLVTGGFAAAAVAELGLAAMTRGLRRMRDVERVAETARADLGSFIETEIRERTLELGRLLARERANASHQLSEQERRLAEERRDTIERQAERARVELTQAVSAVQERLERRLMAWAADLDRGQRALEAQLTELGHRQHEAVAAYEARLAADGERVAAASEEQRLALLKLREELQRLGTEFLEEGRNEIEVHAAERRRALHEVGERIRNRERALREQIDREEGEARGRLAAGLGDAEQRHLAALDRALDRASTRLLEYAEKHFDTQIRESREKAAERLSRELDKGIEQFTRQAEKEISDRIAQMARQTAEQLERRITDVTRSGEAQLDLAADRIRKLSERLDGAIAAAEDRLATIESDLERAGLHARD
jgi:gas vesicle protein